MIHFIDRSSINNRIILRYKLPINPDESESNFRRDITINICSSTHWPICFSLALPWNITAFYIMEIFEKNQAYLGLIFLSPHLAYFYSYSYIFWCPWMSTTLGTVISWMISYMDARTDFVEWQWWNLLATYLSFLKAEQCTEAVVGWS